MAARAGPRAPCLRGPRRFMPWGVPSRYWLAATRWPSLERASIPLEMRHLAQRLALLLASSHGASRVAERKDRQHIEAGRDVEESLDLLEPTEAYPFRARAIGPRRQQHGLNRAARVGHGEPSLVGRHDDCQRRLGDIRPARCQGPEPAQCLAVADHDEVPGLPVHPTAREASRLDDPPDHGVWHRLVLVTAHGEEGANGLEDVHRLHDLHQRGVSLWMSPSMVFRSVGSSRSRVWTLPTACRTVV